MSYADDKERINALSERVNYQKNYIACLEFDLRISKELLKQCKEKLNEISNLNPRCYGIDTFAKCQEIAKECLACIAEFNIESE